MENTGNRRLAPGEILCCAQDDISSQFPLAYLYLRQRDRKELFMAPLHLARVQGTPEQFQIEIHPPGVEKLTFAGISREYGDFGDRIVNTLVADLEIRQGDQVIARAHGTAGLERRVPDHSPR